MPVAARRYSLILLFPLLAIEGLWAQQEAPEDRIESAGASRIFRRYAPFVRKIQVLEAGSAAKAVIGSGFYVTADGHLVSNYHVVSNLITRPDRYRAELVEENGSTTPVTVLAIDVVHDLAILKVGKHGGPFFKLGPVQKSNGQRLFALGNPKDLGMSIVEGTYNGLLQHTLYPRIHLTASLNPGMSGGPTIDEQGRVVGINVSTEGNQVSFLVPVDRAVTLLAAAQSSDVKDYQPTLKQVGEQLRRHQESYVAELFAGDTKTSEFGPFRVMTQPAPFFRCWGDADREDRQTFETTSHSCSTQDEIYLDRNQTTGAVTVDHELITTTKLNAPRFFALYTQRFSNDNAPYGNEEYVTKWECVTRNVQNDKTQMRTALCLRRYRKFGELYDASLQLAVLGRADVGLVSTLNMSGVTYDNVQKLTAQYLRHVSWR